jgi:heme-degrading monooxygenase HmoA
MIARIWNGSTAPADADRYLTHLQQNVMPELTAIDGYRGIQVLRRDTKDVTEFIVTTFWQSMEAIRDFTGADSGVAVVAPQAQAILGRYDRHAKHYEVAVSTLSEHLRRIDP